MHFSLGISLRRLIGAIEVIPSHRRLKFSTKKKQLRKAVKHYLADFFRSGGCGVPPHFSKLCWAEWFQHHKNQFHTCFLSIIVIVKSWTIFVYQMFWWKWIDVSGNPVCFEVFNLPPPYFWLYPLPSTHHHLTHPISAVHEHQLAKSSFWSCHLPCAELTVRNINLDWDMLLWTTLSVVFSSFSLW